MLLQREGINDVLAVIPVNQVLQLLSACSLLPPMLRLDAFLSTLWGQAYPDFSDDRH
jgi:hypothetical protein